MVQRRLHQLAFRERVPLLLDRPGVFPDNCYGVMAASR